MRSCAAAGSGKLADQTAWLQYRISKSKTKIELKKVHVPKVLRGLNLAEMLCDAVFDSVLREGQRVKLTAGYAKKVYIDKHPRRLERCLPAEGADAAFSEDENEPKEKRAVPLSSPRLSLTLKKVKLQSPKPERSKPKAQKVKPPKVSSDPKKWSTTAADRAARKVKAVAPPKPSGMWPGADSDWSPHSKRKDSPAVDPSVAAKRQKAAAAQAAPLRESRKSPASPVTPEQQSAERYESYLRKRRCARGCKTRTTTHTNSRWPWSSHSLRCARRGSLPAGACGRWRRATPKSPERGAARPSSSRRRTRKLGSLR